MKRVNLKSFLIAGLIFFCVILSVIFLKPANTLLTGSILYFGILLVKTLKYRNKDDDYFSEDEKVGIFFTNSVGAPRIHEWLLCFFFISLYVIFNFAF